MKKWAKILIWIAIIWGIITLAGLTILYFQLGNISELINLSNKPIRSEPSVSSSTQRLLETINLSSPIPSLLRWLLVLSFPSLILLAISLVWGRNKTNQLSNQPIPTQNT